MRFLISVLLSVFFVMQSAYPEEKNWQTYWGNKKREKTDPLKIYPKSQVPINPDAIIWSVQQVAGVEAKNTTTVPVYMRQSSSVLAVHVGDIAIGEEVKLEGFFVKNSHYQYKVATPSSFVPSEPISKDLKFVWLPGKFIKADRLADTQNEKKQN